MRRTPLARGTSTLRRTRLKPRSAKRVDEQDEYLDARMAVNARDNGRCQAERLVPSVRCAGTNDPHHVHPTGDQGPRCDVDNIITVCRAHHDWTHAQANRRQALELGLLAGRHGYTFADAIGRRRG